MYRSPSDALERRLVAVEQPEALQVRQGPSHRVGVDVAQFAQHFRAWPPFGAVVAEELQHDDALRRGSAIGKLIGGGGHLRFLLCLEAPGGPLLASRRNRYAAPAPGVRASGATRGGCHQQRAPHMSMMREGYSLHAGMSRRLPVDWMAHRLAVRAPDRHCACRRPATPPHRARPLAGGRRAPGRRVLHDTREDRSRPIKPRLGDGTRRRRRARRQAGRAGSRCRSGRAGSKDSMTKRKRSGRR